MPKLGNIDIRELNTPPEKHELATAKFFARRGKDIKFIRPSNIQGVHTPDFWMDGIAWEVKSSRGKTSRCISDNIRDAMKQSQNIILDLRRSKIPDNVSIHKIKSELRGRKGLTNVLVITKQRRLLTIKSAGYKI